MNKEYTCLLCDGEWELDCPDCKDGTRKCAHCGGKRVEKRACEDCNGAGSLPDPRMALEEPASTCGWCKGERSRPCPDLAAEAHSTESVQVKCGACLGKKKVTCIPCAGGRKVPCEKCRGHGQTFQFPIGTTPGSYHKCTDCNGKGSAACLDCKSKGKVDCERCEATGKHTPRCKICRGSDMIPCAGCFRSSPRYWEVAGSILEGQGEGDRAAASYGYAVQLLGNHKVERSTFDAAFGFDYVLGRVPKKNEIAKDGEARIKGAEKRIAEIAEAE